MQGQIDRLATASSVEDLKQGQEDINERINRLEIRVMQRIDDAIKSEGAVKDEQAKAERDRIMRIVSIQAGILVSAILALVTAVVVHLVGGFL